MSDPEKMESVILCEGYHDRAFWKGWLTRLGCTDPGIKPGLGTRIPVKDPWGKPVAGHGQYAYLSSTGKFIRVRPCDGKDTIWREAQARLKARVTNALSRLIINVDPDISASGGSGTETGLRGQDVLIRVQTAIDPDAVINADSEIEIDGGATRIALIRWEVSDPPTVGLPDKQTLERLVCAAVVSAYPQRGQSVHDWLSTRHEPPPSIPKEYAWSYMAGWYAENGCDDFYCRLWDDDKVGSQFETRLRASGAWKIVETLVT